MQKIIFKYKDTCLINQKEIFSAVNKLVPEIKKIKNELKKEFNTPYAFANLSKDINCLKNVKNIVEQKLSFSPTLLVIIAIGGSNLGTKAVIEALYGNFYNNKNSRLKVYFVDTTDSDHTFDIYNLVEDELNKGSNIILNVVSKSGNTTETIANFEIFFNLMKTTKPKNFNEFIIVTTQKDSLLWHFAKKIKCSILEIPAQVGGRFSVLSSVGLFAFELLSINSTKLLDGANDFLNSCIDEDLDNNIAAISATISYLHYKNNLKINDIFLFANDLQALGNWYRQLIGESIGKEFNIENKKANIGITPTVSIGSTDLHSVGQLYLVNQKNKFTTFVNVLNNRSNLEVPYFNEFEKLVPNIQRIQLSRIMDAIVKATKLTYLKKEIPFCSIILPEKSEYIIGQFLQYKMFEIIYLSYLLKINPFDQPNVELYKKETKKILKKMNLLKDS